METGSGLPWVAAPQIDLTEYTEGQPEGFGDPFHDHRVGVWMVMMIRQDLAQAANHSKAHNQIPGLMAEVSQGVSDLARLLR